MMSLKDIPPETLKSIMTVAEGIAAKDLLDKLGIDIKEVMAENIRLGICPDCGNKNCMPDGVTGLWCPACDASYLL